MPYRWYVPVVFGVGGSLSSAYDVGGGASRMGVIMPADWDAAAISFQVAPTEGGTYADLYTEAGVEVHFHPSQGNAYAMDTQGKYLAPYRFVKVRSGQTAGPVAQVHGCTVYFWFMR